MLAHLYAVRKPYYLLPLLSQWCWSIRYMMIDFHDHRGASSLRYRNRTETTVLMYEKEPCPPGTVFAFAVQELSGIVRK